MNHGAAMLKSMLNDTSGLIIFILLAIILTWSVAR
jgi:hypothetical protein